MTFEETFPVGSQLFIPADREIPVGWEEILTYRIPAVVHGEKSGVALALTIIERVS